MTNPPVTTRDDTRRPADEVIAEIRAVPCPFTRVKEINQVVQDHNGTLPGALATLAAVRVEALQEGLPLTGDKTIAELARRVNMRRSRVSTLLKGSADVTGRNRPVTENQPKENEQC